MSSSGSSFPRLFLVMMLLLILVSWSMWRICTDFSYSLSCTVSWCFAKLRILCSKHWWYVVKNWWYAKFNFSVFPMIRWFRSRRHDLPLHSTHGASDTLFIHLHSPLGNFTFPQPFLWCFFISSCFFLFLHNFYSNIISCSNVYVFCSRLNVRAYPKTPEKVYSKYYYIL